MNAALAARVQQLEAYRDYRRSVAEWHQRRAAERQALVSSLLTELVAAVAQLPLVPDGDGQPNQHTKWGSYGGSA